MRHIMRYHILHFILSLFFLNVFANYSQAQDIQDIKDIKDIKEIKDLKEIKDIKEIKEIRQAFDEYNFEKAISLIDNLDSIDSECMNIKIQSLKELNKWQEAIRLMEQNIVRDSTKIKTWVELAECYKKTGNLDKSSDAYKKAVELAPERVVLRTKYINSLINNEKTEEARKACHDWLKSDSTAATAYRLLGQTYEKENYEAALIGYVSAYNRDSTNAENVIMLANQLNNGKYYESVIDITEKYRLIDSLNIDVNRQNAKAYCLSGMYKEAINRYESLKRLGDKTYLTYFYLGLSYYGDNWFYGAYDNLKKAIEIMPPSEANTDALYYFAKSAVRTSWKKEGTEAMENVLKLTVPSDSTMVKIYKGLAYCYNMSLNFKEYINSLKKEYEYSRQNSILYTIGCHYYRRKDMDNALKYLNMYMNNVPEKDRYIYDDKGNIDESRITYYQDAMKKTKKIKENKFFEGDEFQ